MTLHQRIYREKDGKLIKGTIFNVFVFEEEYHLTQIKAYADGFLDCLGPTSFSELERHLNTGKLVISPPDGARIFVPYMGYAFINHPDTTQNISRFLKIIEEEILALSSNLVEDCIEAFRNYLIDPSGSNLHKLKYSYDLLPDKSNGVFEHPSKDPLIILMNDMKPFTIEERKYMLKDYFQGEWLELK